MSADEVRRVLHAATGFDPAAALALRIAAVAGARRAELALSGGGTEPATASRS